MQYSKGKRIAIVKNTWYNEDFYTEERFLNGKKKLVTIVKSRKPNGAVIEKIIKSEDLNKRDFSTLPKSLNDKWAHIEKTLDMIKEKCDVKYFSDKISSFAPPDTFSAFNEEFKKFAKEEFSKVDDTNIKYPCQLQHHIGNYVKELCKKGLDVNEDENLLKLLEDETIKENKGFETFVKFCIQESIPANKKETAKE